MRSEPTGRSLAGPWSWCPKGAGERGHDAESNRPFEPLPKALNLNLDP